MKSGAAIIALCAAWVTTGCLISELTCSCSVASIIIYIHAGTLIELGVSVAITWLLILLVYATAGS